ncbi:anion transporter [Cyclonatronum proteinivorum]|uniref:Anion transporter n=1 Tax=Cyclonatronum proteinivorum TaxID=1457365 RepID=A0A345UP32_9BACT|nr:SLC13 family permease [Cyclonatronum proteinivorum]AXJ02234.1 anion transporter [Cyclonatronum proteinivorum]
MRKKKKRFPDWTKTVVGLTLGAVGFLIPLLVQFDGLSFAGHLTLGIFLVAASFWMLEPIPIYATSMLVIFLQIVLLSTQGPLFQDSALPEFQLQAAEQEQVWRVPDTAVDGTTIWLRQNARSSEALDIEVVQSEGGFTFVRSEALSEGTTIVSDVNHKLVGYTPASYTLFLGTLASPIIILFLGGFMLAAAAVKYNLDKNLTNVLLKPFGQKPMFIILGLMLVTAVLSAFMSNTATTAMMMTVAIPIALQIDVKDKFRIILALSIPIAANLGGMATPIGTPPNAIVISALNQQGIELAFGTWMLIATPLVVVMLLVAWGLMRFFYPPTIESFKLELDSAFDKSPRAIMMYVVFALTVILWVTEAQHGIPSGMVAFLPIMGLTVSSVLEKEDIRKLPWEVLWLVAGGISLGLSMENTGLAVWLVSSISWDMLPQIMLLLVFGFVALMLSNFLSNTVTATLLIPLAVSMGTSGIAGEGFSLVISAVLIGMACNMAMLLPISTPPNAIAMSTGYIQTADMVKVGGIIGVIGLFVALAYAMLFWPAVLL